MKWIELLRLNCYLIRILTVKDIVSEAKLADVKPES